MTDIATVLVSILVEATPFLLLGIFISTVIRKTNTFDKFVSRLPKNTYARRAIIPFFGFALPVCECGNVPLARTLMMKGFTTAEATTFLLAAPILNPITFVTTREAFRSVPLMLPARMIGGLMVALIVGELVGRLRSKKLTDEFSHVCKENHKAKTLRTKPFSIIFAEEFWPMFKYLAIGALIAATTQFVLTQSFLSGFASSYIGGVLLMLILGFVISICSSVDAFFALAYAGTVRYGALLTFLIAGPMVDIKLIAMLKSTFTKRTLLVITASVAFLASLIGLGASYVG